MNRPVDSFRLVTIALLGATSLIVTSAAAESTIRQPGQHPRYRFDAEPHFNFRPLEPPVVGTGTGTGLGPGFRGTVIIVDQGPVSSINNSFGIGFGFDWLHYAEGGRCTSTRCDDTEVNHYFIPLVAQWNFWLAPHWSVFGEAGLAYRFSPQTEDKLDTFVFGGGGRFSVGDRLALTLRAGWPMLSAGVSIWI